jgi:outer membrane lipoprotein-sorting protein
MKIGRALLAVVILLSLSVAAAAQTAEEIIAKAVDAMGGADALKAVNSTRVIGRFSIPSYGMNLALEVYSKRPNKKKIVLEQGGQRYIRCTNGTVAWQVNPLVGIMEPTQLDAYTTGLINQTSSVDSFFFNLEERGVAVEFIGKETVEGEELNGLRYTFPGGYVMDLYFQPDTGLMRLSVTHFNNPQTGEQVEGRTYLSDYREDGGLVVAHREDDYEGALHTIVEIISVETNVEIDDAEFEMPAAEAAK